MGLAKFCARIFNYLIIAIFAINMITVASANAGMPKGLLNALTALCQISQQVLGIAVMLLVVLAGTVYAIGQVLGAETRARASVWATAMLTGAVIGIIIFLVAPYLISIMLSDQTNVLIDPKNPCGSLIE